MSQLPRFSRARQLTASVWPGKAADVYADIAATRLRKLAAAGSTGMLPFSGAGDGAIYFRDGKVVFARSTRTPGPAAASDGPAGAGTAGAGTAGAGTAGAGTPGAATPYNRLTAALAVAEPTVDATAELLSGDSRFGKFRAARTPPAGDAAPGIDVERLLAEVARRQRILHQLSPVVTADLVVARNPYLKAPEIRVSALQWALLIRVRDGSTPRALAWELGRSVFGTTIEVYRLLALGLLWPADQRAHRNARNRAYGPATMSFVRAVSPGPGGLVTADVSAGARGSSGAGSEV